MVIHSLHHSLHLMSLTIGLITGTIVWWALAYWVARIYAASTPSQQSSGG